MPPATIASTASRLANEAAREIAKRARDIADEIVRSVQEQGGLFTKADLAPLDQALADAKAKGLSDDSPFCIEATAARERIKGVLSLQDRRRTFQKAYKTHEI